MSFFSAGDLVMFLKGLGKLASILRNESVDAFRQCSKTYKSFLQAARWIDRFINAHDLHEDAEFKKARRNIEKLLRRFFGEIKEFKQHLGSGRRRKSLRTVIAKIKWSFHKDKLLELRSSLKLEMDMLNLLMQMRAGSGCRFSAHLDEAQTPPTRAKKYYAILVTLPPVHTYGPISDRICATSDKPPPIPWTSTDTRRIPSLTASLAFRRHFALCLVEQETWEGTRKSLAEKFEGQLFWDYAGDSTDCSRAASWLPCKIRKINAIQELGIIAKGDAARICTEYYLKIRDNWDYLPIWWNDADFTLVLACLMVNDTAIQTCRAVMNHLARLRETDIIVPRTRACEKGVLTGAAGFVGGLVLTAVTGGLAAPVAFPVALGSYGICFGSGVSECALQEGEEARRKRRIFALTKLQRRFPLLQQLFSQKARR